MREMQDSRIEWIGEIPKSWTITILSALFSECKCKNSGLTENNLLSLSYGNIVRKNIESNEGLLPASFETYNIIEPGNIVFRLTDLQNDKRSLRTGLCKERGIITSAYVTLQIRSDDSPRYMHYLFHTYDLCKVFYGMGDGVRQGMNYEDLKRLRILRPDQETQRRIADYLDRKCSQIDAIIARQQEVIEKLKAYKLSVITEAVTKGLNPDVPMKDSGVEWIGEIPEHWDFRRIKNCCLIVDCKNRTPDPDPDGEYIVVRTTCIRDGSFSYEGSYHTNAENFKEWTAKGQPQHGDIFFTREAPMGEACLVPDDDNLCMGQRVMFFRPLDGSDPRYILYSIYGPLAREYIDSKNKGSTVGHLKLGQVASLPLFYCPPKEQNEIADYLDKRCGAIDKVVEKKTEIISKLTDYKKSLIYEVVTGKKEV